MSLADQHPDGAWHRYETKPVKKEPAHAPIPLHEDEEPIRVLYTNHRGETSIRTVTPIGQPRFTADEWHAKPQWLMPVYDHDKKAERTYALADCCFVGGRSGVHTTPREGWW